MNFGLAHEQDLIVTAARDFPALAALYGSEGQLEVRARSEKRAPVWRGR